MMINKILRGRAGSDVCFFQIAAFTLAWLILGEIPAFAQQIVASGSSQQARTLHLRFPGEQPRPLSMVAGDFNEDGIADLVIGYALQKGGFIALLHGNLDARAPQTYESWTAVGQHQYAVPYLQIAKPVSIATQPSVMISADVNGDGHLDLVYATRGSNQLNIMFGDGRGNFAPPVSAQLAGSVTALAAYRPGAPALGEAIIAAYQVNSRGRLSILSYASNGFATSATYSMPAPVTSMRVANLDADLIPDAAIVTNGQLLILHGKDAITGRGALTTVPVSHVLGVTTGQFLFDRHAQLQLSVVTGDGDVLTLAHQGFDPRPFTPEEISETRRRQHRHSNNIQTLARQAGNTGDEGWIEVERSTAAALRSVNSRPPIMVPSRGAGGFDDLVVVDTSAHQQTRFTHAPASPGSFSVGARLPSGRIVSSRLSSDNVIAAVSARVSPDARDGLVMLSAESVSPAITVPSAGNTFFVNTTSDNTGTTTDPPDSVRCTNGSGERCTLRDAITFANSDAGANIAGGQSDTIMLPAGTYNLTWQAGTFDDNGNALTHLEILGPVSIVGSTSSSVIVNGNNNDVIFTINPGAFGSSNPSGDTYTFDLAMSNLTLENGQNNNAPNDSQLYNNVGGCINWDAAGSGNLTLTNVVIQNCTALWGPGGGIWATNSFGGGTGTLTLTGGTIQNNSTAEVGGAVALFSPPAAMSATGTVFSGNKADVNVNPDDGNFGGAGGGLSFDERTSPDTPQTTLTNVTISGNTAAQNDGGGIFTNSGLLISSSIIENNSAARWGGGMLSEVLPTETQTTVTSSNFLSNSATEAGGAISGGIANQIEGNILQISLSRIFGNSSTNGASGVAAGAPGTDSGQTIATENWWGCNGGPATTGDGCDQAVLYSPSSGSLTTDPYAQLGFTSDITTIPPGGSMNLSTTMNTDSAGNPITGAFPAVATNYSYTYQVTGVTSDPALTTGAFDGSGAGSAKLTPVTPATTTNGSVTVTFDKQTDTINFTAQAPTATSLLIAASPSATYLYGQPSSFTVQLTPSNATGITASDFSVTVDSSSTGYSVSLISNNKYQISGPFNALAPGGHTLGVSFVGTTDFPSSNTSANLTVNTGTVTISNAVTPANPVQGQGGTVKVTVAGVGTGAGPTGSITYAFNGGSSQSATLSGGVANITIPAIIPTGSNSLSLGYSGDTNYAPASTSVSITVFGRSQTTIATLTATTAQINVFGFGFTAPSGQLAFNDVTSGNPVTGPVTLHAATATPSLLPQVTTSTGSFPVWTELADLNEDGVPDLVTSVFGTDSVTVQLGNGDGTFGTATSTLIATGFGPSEIHAVSLRGNSTLDLIAGSFNTNQIAVLLGNGNGTFEAPVFYTVGSGTNTPTSLTTGDFNHDSNLDVAVANTGDNTVSILTGNGGGSLTPAGTAINVGQTPEAIRAGDFNGDGYSDLAVANYHDGTVSILLNNQNGTFAAHTVGVGSNSGPQALAITGSSVSQLLAVANFGSNSVSVLRNNGSGIFAIVATVIVGKGPDDVRFADFNNDSIPDLIVANYTDGTLSLATGGAGDTYTVLGAFPIGKKPYSAAAGDIDTTGTPDIVVANTFSNNTGVLSGGTQISVPYTGLSLPAGNTLNATYSPDGNSKYGTSTSPNAVAP